MQFKNFAIVGLVILGLIACDSKERVKAPTHKQNMEMTKEAPASGHTVTVNEVIQATSYTYLRVTEGNKEYWIATSKQDVEEGQTLSYNQGLEMKNFTSKELERDFESIWFVNQMNGAGSMGQSAAPSSPKGKELVARDQKISVAKVSGGVTIEELYAKPEKYSGKTVSVRGEVSKFSAKIMNRNWVHLQDGTSTDGKFDLTVTTMDAVKVGDVVVFKGSVSLNKDFGAGYKYELIMEDAVLVSEG